MAKRLSFTKWQFPQIGQRYGIKNKAAIILQCKLNVKLIAALLFIRDSSPQPKELQLFKMTTNVAVYDTLTTDVSTN